jgi:hypothetical protein
MFENFTKSECQVVGTDGTIRGTTKGVFSGKMVAIDDTAIVILPGDELRRKLPNGIEESFEVVDPRFYERHGSIKAHYQVDVKRKGVFQEGKGGNYNVHVTGHNAHVNIASQDYSTNVVSDSDLFAQIRNALQEQVKNDGERQKLLAAVEEMNKELGRAGFVGAYQRFVSLAADHLGVITPFLPALTNLFGG